MKPALRQMLDTIRSEAQATASLTGRAVFTEAVMQAMAEVPREKFVPVEYKYAAFTDGPLRIGYGQTISQPYIVALMTDLLDLTPQSIVLEIGTGSGYQAAILSRLARQVYSIERIPELAASAHKRLQTLGYTNIETHCANGYRGWAEKAPFDAIIVTAAAGYVPEALLEQLKPGGRMVIPIGLPYLHQELLCIRKDQEGKTHTESVLDVAFVPLIDDDDKTGVNDENA